MITSVGRHLVLVMISFTWLVSGTLQKMGSISDTTVSPFTIREATRMRKGELVQLGHITITIAA